jgi:hypothetical protein
MLQSEAGYIDARPHVPQLDEILLQRTAGPYSWVICDRGGRSHTTAHVRFAPKGDRPLSKCSSSLSANSCQSQDEQRLKSATVGNAS